MILSQGRGVSGRGDIIVGLNGEPVIDWPSLLSAINNFKVGDRITLDLIRNGDRMKADLTLAKWQDNCL